MKFLLPLFKAIHVVHIHCINKLNKSTNLYSRCLKTQLMHTSMFWCKSLKWVSSSNMHSRLGPSPHIFSSSLRLISGLELVLHCFIFTYSTSAWLQIPCEGVEVRIWYQVWEGQSTVLESTYNLWYALLELRLWWFKIKLISLQH